MAGSGAAAGGNVERNHLCHRVVPPAAKPGPVRNRFAIAILALLLIALLGFYTLVTGRITDGSAKLKDGATRLPPAPTS